MTSTHQVRDRAGCISETYLLQASVNSGLLQDYFEIIAEIVSSYLRAANDAYLQKPEDCSKRGAQFMTVKNSCVLTCTRCLLFNSTVKMQKVLSLWQACSFMVFNCFLALRARCFRE